MGWPLSLLSTKESSLSPDSQIRPRLSTQTVDRASSPRFPSAAVDLDAFPRIIVDKAGVADKCITYLLVIHVITLNRELTLFNSLSLQVLQEYKFEFIRIVCSHEHYVQLSLPTLRSGYARTKGELSTPVWPS